MVTQSEILQANVLIVDDDSAQIALLERLLGAAGYSSIASTMDPRQVCDLHRARHFDLILLDLEMPTMNGFQVLERLRDVEPDDYVPVVVITAHPDHKLPALQAGAKAFISKPFALAEVLTQTQNMLEVRLLHTRARKDALALRATVQEFKATDEVKRQQSEELTALYDQVLVEQKLSERLMLNVLPGSAAGRLRGHPDVVADNHPDVTVLVADVSGFAGVVPRPSPAWLEQTLTRLFVEFDRAVLAQGLVSYWTVGDPYLAAAGLGSPTARHAEQAATLGAELIAILARFSHRLGENLHLRVGISSGPVAGVSGKRMFIYDLWGDTVQVAARLEAGGQLDQVLVSESTHALLGPGFRRVRRPDAHRSGAPPPNAWLVSRAD